MQRTWVVVAAALIALSGCLAAAQEEPAVVEPEEPAHRHAAEDAVVVEPHPAWEEGPEAWPEGWIEVRIGDGNWTRDAEHRVTVPSQEAQESGLLRLELPDAAGLEARFVGDVPDGWRGTWRTWLGMGGETTAPFDAQEPFAVQLGSPGTVDLWLFFEHPRGGFAEFHETASWSVAWQVTGAVRGVLPGDAAAHRVLVPGAESGRLTLETRAEAATLPVGRSLSLAAFGAYGEVWCKGGQAQAMDLDDTEQHLSLDVWGGHAIEVWVGEPPEWCWSNQERVALEGVTYTLDVLLEGHGAGRYGWH